MSLNKVDFKKQIGFVTATSIVVTNMIGAGVFTSLGFQLIGIRSPAAIVLLWLLGGVIALSGVLVYAELAVRFPRSGGEYNFLSNIIHPLPGFLAGWLSATVGFAAPIALSAIAFGSYLSKVVPAANPSLAACCCITTLAIVHSINVRNGAIFQNIVTYSEISLIIFLIFAGLLIPSPQPLSLMPDVLTLKDVFSASFAVSLVYVFYAYSGWNASTYIVSEIKNPQKNLPASLITGTVLVTMLYILLNFVFLYTTPLQELQGKLEVGYISATKIFGAAGGKIMASIICIALIGSISGMTIAGPRVPNIISEDYPLFKLFLRRNHYGSPYIAILFQSAIALLLIVSGTFETILTYIGFTLSLCTCLTVSSIFIIKFKKKNPLNGYRCWGYPVTPILFLLLNLWMLLYIFYERPLESGLGLATLFTGIPVYFWAREKNQKKPSELPLYK
jgi:basic amino acid/polyamine antiporter, APA family